MGLLSADDWSSMAADLAEARTDNAVSIVIRRGSTTLAAQTVRLTGTGRAGAQMVGNRTEQIRGSVLVLGATTLNIQPGDRFNDAAGLLYEVTLVKPNRRAGTIAEATVAE